MSKDPLRLAIIGCGGIARRHLAALDDLKSRDLNDVVITAVCDANEENAKSLAQDVETRFGARPTIYSDYQQLLTKEKLDAADLCLPHGLHHGVSIDCMRSGLHVICEKPLGVTIAASRKMAEVADQTGKILATAVPYRRLPGQRAVHWALNESGLIGRPLSFFHHYTRAGRPRPTNQVVPPALAWRLDRQMSGGGMVMDSGFHYCDSIRYFLGDVEKVYAEARGLGTGEPISLAEDREDTVFVTLTFKSGVVGTWCWSLAAPGESIGNVIFYGSEGSLRDTTDSGALIFHLFWRDEPRVMEDGVLTKRDSSKLTLAEVEKLHLAATGDNGESLFPRGCTDGFAIEIYDFTEAVRGNRAKPEVDAWGGLRSLAICESVYESAFTGEVVRTDDVIAGKKRAYQKMVDDRWGL